MPEQTYDLAIVGGGAAGLTAGLYACRAGLKTVLFESLMTGGQVINAENIENFPGFPDGISGAEFGPLLQEQATRYGLEIRLGEVTALRPESQFWAIELYGGLERARAVIYAAGSTLRKLGVPGEQDLEGAGVSYCATCDGPFFQGETVGVVGGGDSALDEALVLTEFASKVVVFHRGDELGAQQVLRDRVAANPKIEVRYNTTVDEVLGGGAVEGISITDVESGETSRVDLSGLFIYVGLDPNSSCLDGLLELDGVGHVPTDVWMRTPLPGLLAAGDVRQGSAAQLVTSAGDGATAAIAAQRYVKGAAWPDFNIKDYTPAPTKAEVITFIQNESETIKGFGVTKIGLFGSYVRGQQRKDSTIDLLVEYGSGQSTFKNFTGLACFFEDEFGRMAVPTTTDSLDPHIAQNVLIEVEYVELDAPSGVPNS